MIQKAFKSPLFYLFISLYIIAGFHILTFDNNIGKGFLSEDHYFENVGALSFFVASLLFFKGFWNLRNVRSEETAFRLKRIVVLGLAVLFFFAAGEEISWGQRIFSIQTPELLMKVNAQEEITVHNISFWGMQIPFETMFDVLWLFLIVIVPFASLYKPAGERLERFLPITHWGVGMLFLFNYFWAKFAKLYYADLYVFNLVSLPFVQAVQEIKESNYSVLFMIAALYILIRTSGAGEE